MGRRLLKNKQLQNNLFLCSILFFPFFILFLPFAVLLVFYGCNLNPRWFVPWYLRENMGNMRKNVIPLDIYTTWHTLDLPPNMKENVDKMKASNPEFQHHLYDETMCRDFIKNNYPEDVVHAFDALVPLSYKSDLWRYCVLHKRGGIYMDIKIQMENGFSLIDLVDREYFTLDRPYMQTISLEDELALINDPNYSSMVQKRNPETGLYTAFLVCQAGNPVLGRCIRKIVENVKQNYYGKTSLDPTGPGLLAKEYFQGEYDKIKQIELFHSLNGFFILNKKGIITGQYPEYRDEQKKYGKGEYYTTTWENRKIYNN